LQKSQEQNARKTDRMPEESRAESGEKEAAGKTSVRKTCSPEMQPAMLGDEQCQPGVTGVGSQAKGLIRVTQKIDHPIQKIGEEGNFS